MAVSGPGRVEFYDPAADRPAESITLDLNFQYNSIDNFRGQPCRRAEVVDTVLLKINYGYDRPPSFGPLDKVLGGASVG